MNYSNTFKWLHATWNVDSPEAHEVVEEMVDRCLNKHATITIHFKSGRSTTMQAWVNQNQDITEHALWKGMTDWLSRTEDNSPYHFTSSDGEYHTCIVKSEVVRIEMVEEKDQK